MLTRAKCRPLAPRNACALFHSSALPKNLQSLGGGRAPRVLGDTRLEAVLELAGDGAEVPHAAGTGGLSALGLLGPVVCYKLVPEFGCGDGCSPTDIIYAASTAGTVAHLS